MPFNHFFRLSLAFQILVGVGLFSVSLLIELQVLQAFLVTPLAAVGLTLVLECGKIAAIVWHRYLSVQPTLYPVSTRYASFAFRGGLVLLSLLCSLLFLANHLDRPRLEETRAADLKELQLRHAQARNALAARYQERRQAFDTQQEESWSQLAIRHQENVDRLEQQLDQEMGNVVHGQFKGPRYQEIERRLEQSRQAMNTALERLAERQQKEQNAFEKQLSKELAEQQKQMDTRYAQDRDALKQNRYTNDERVNDPYIIAFLSLSQAIAPMQIKPMQFVFAFSLLISLLMELGIVLSFDTITVALLPALQQQHQEDIDTEILKTQLASQTRQQDIRHKSWLDRVVSAADKTLEGADKLADSRKFADPEAPRKAP